ncbi:unnamed protein product [Closterium sp. NIES-53]
MAACRLHMTVTPVAGLRSSTVLKSSFVACPRVLSGPIRSNSLSASNGGRRRFIVHAHKVEVEHQGKTHVLEIPEDETILSAAIDAGLDLPHDCKLGVCMTCPAKLISGEVDQSEGMLSDDVMEQGYALMCASYPNLLNLFLEVDGSLHIFSYLLSAIFVPPEAFYSLVPSTPPRLPPSSSASLLASQTFVSSHFLSSTFLNPSSSPSQILSLPVSVSATASPPLGIRCSVYPSPSPPLRFPLCLPLFLSTLRLPLSVSQLRLPNFVSPSPSPPLHLPNPISPSPPPPLRLVHSVSHSSLALPLPLSVSPSPSLPLCLFLSVSPTASPLSVPPSLSPPLHHPLPASIPPSLFSLPVFPFPFSPYSLLCVAPVASIGRKSILLAIPSLTGPL